MNVGRVGSRHVRRTTPLPAALARRQDPRRLVRDAWRADRIPGGYVVRDDNGQAIAYIYARANEAEARQAKVLTADARDLSLLPQYYAARVSMETSISQPES